MQRAGTRAPDTNPLFWKCWEQLGHAVVLQACRDYANARRILEKHPNPDSAHYNPMVDIGYYEKFFRSKYFGRICPKFDGHMMFDRLKDGGWRHIPRGHHHYTKHAVYSVKTDYYKPKANRDPRGRHCKYD